MILLITLCDLFWLLWALPLLLGMLMWWLGNNKYNGMVTEYEGKLKGLNGRINGLQGDLSECGSKRANLEGDLALTKGRMREMESDMKSLKAAAENSNDGNTHSNKGKKGKGSNKGSNKGESNSGDSGSGGSNVDLGNITSSLTSDGGTESNDSNSDSSESDNGGSNISAMTSAAEIVDSSDSVADATSSLAGAAAGAGAKYKVDHSNLQIVEGIGPKMETVLKENGVNNLSDLGSKSGDDLRAILDKYGDKYKIMNPETWGQQGQLGADGKYDELIDLQKKLDAGKTDAVGYTDSKLEKLLIKSGQIEDPKANAGTGTDATAAVSGDADEKSSGVKSIYSKIKDDNFQIIEGIGPKMESVLKESGVSSISELASQSPSDLQAILDKYGDKYKIIDPTTWAQQAGYAADGDYDGLIDLQKRLDTGVDNAVGMTDSKLEKYLIKTGAIKSFKQDDLKAIEGIGPATEKLLHENGIKTWRELANTDASKVKEILTAAGSRFALGDPTTWPKQAELAADGKFDELREYQDFLDGGRG